MVCLRNRANEDKGSELLLYDAFISLIQDITVPSDKVLKCVLYSCLGPSDRPFMDGIGLKLLQIAKPVYLLKRSGKRRF